MFPVANTPPANKAARRVTIKEVAQHAGVANAAVSIVLNGAKSNSTGVSDAARDRILAAAENLGYRRNGSMVAARSGQFKAIGLLLSTHASASTMPAELSYGIHSELSNHDLHLIVQQLPDAQLTDAAFIPKILREWMCDGLLVDYTHLIPSDLLRLIKQNHVPAIWLNTKLQTDCVYPNNFEAGYRAASHLMNRGHKNILYSSYLDTQLAPAHHFSVIDRREGYSAAVEEAGLRVETFSPHEDLPYDDQLEKWRERLLSAERPTGVVTYGSIDCSLLIHAAEVVGLKIPQDLSVITFAGTPYVFHGKAVTTFVVPEVAMGRSAVSGLLQKIASPNNDLLPVVLPFNCDLGGTCAAPPKVS